MKACEYPSRTYISHVIIRRLNPHADVDPGVAMPIVKAHLGNYQYCIWMHNPADGGVPCAVRGAHLHTITQTTSAWTDNYRAKCMSNSLKANCLEMLQQSVRHPKQMMTYLSCPPRRVIGDNYPIDLGLEGAVQQAQSVLWPDDID